MTAPKKKRGRPPLHDKAMRAYAVRLTTQQANRARKLGGGDLSEGVRKLIDGVTPDYDSASIASRATPR